MKIENAVVLVTGANRGIGLSFARALLARGARKVDAGARDPGSMALHMAYVDTDLTRGFDVPKTRPEDIVTRALDGLESGLDDVLADDLTRQVKGGMTAPRPSYLP